MINFNPSKQEKETLTAAFREEKHLEDEGFDRWVLLEPVGHSGEAVPNE